MSEELPLLKYKIETKGYIEAEAVGKALIAVDKEYRKYIKKRFKNKGHYKDFDLIHPTN